MGYSDAIVLVTACLVVGAIVVWLARSSRKVDDKFKEYVASIPSLKKTKTMVNSRRTSAIILDVEEENICLIWLTEDEYRHKRYDVGDVLECEVVEDGVPIHSIKDLRKPAPALDKSDRPIGINAIRGSQRFLKKIRNIKLRLVVADPERPSHSVTFAQVDIERGSHRHQRAIERGRKWLDVIAVAQRRLATKEP